ncbi:Retrovirus-related Pol polyprotein from transposon TNT 1-94 [Dendrobium catenatum]|uniref:Retrovirus-related Pol polyprotein from transposon TNT 1-94 n=1 Tax=Dendrobium catenatum TaxID=906689 RepID=A0A2I0WI61_9ASPA|nr:Retrovirus-related Pol polyprotein from transposon TNT 1-94 [Dendrobium catenatum]
MNTQTMTQYLTEIKTIVDQITAAGSTIVDEDILMYTINGLPPTYQAFKTSIRTMLHPISLDDLYSLLLSEEIHTQKEALSNLSLTETATALYSYRGKGRRGRGRGTQFSPRTGSTNLPTCQICNKRGHTATECWHRMNPDYKPQPQETKQQTTQKAMVMTTEQNSPDWYLDSGASSHLTNSLENLNQPRAYMGTDAITIGDGRNIPIANAGSGIIPTPNSKLRLSQILHIPQISYNLLSISALTRDNNISISFDAHGFVIKDLQTHQVLLKGPSSKGLYPVSVSNKDALTAR